MQSLDDMSLVFIVAKERHGLRIDSFLTTQLRNYTSWRFARLVAAGCVTVDDQPAEPSVRVCTGQAVRIRLGEGADKLLEPEAGEVEFVYLDPWLAVVNKRPDVICHPTGPVDSGTLVHHLQNWLDQRSARKGMLRPGIVHRLDRETSGALAVAFEADAHRGLAEMFEHSRVSKSYLAIVEGIVERDRLTIDRAIGRARAGSRVLMSCRGDAIDRKPSKTLVRTLARFNNSNCTLVRCIPRTGRNHQIRVHMASVGHPLVGDEYYKPGGTFHGEGMRPETGLPIRRHALHAERLAFAHPIGGGWIDVTAPVPSDFRASLAILQSREPR